MRKIGADIGRSFVKVAYFDNNNQLIKRSVRSIAGTKGGTIDLHGNRSPGYYCEGQEWHIVESSADARDTTFSDYPYDSVNTVLLHHAIKSAGIKNDEIELSACIPLNDYYSARLENLARKKHAMTLPVFSVDMKPLAKIEHARTLPEALSGWIDVCFNFDGTPNGRMPSGDAGLVDIGGGTTDICVTNGLNIYSDSIATIPRGYLDVFKNLNKLINTKYPNSGKFPISVLDDALSSKQLEVEANRTVDISNEVKQALKMFSDETLRDVNRILGGDRNLMGTCFLGGGVYHIEKTIRAMPKIFIPDDPQFANAVGALKGFKL